MSSQYVVVCFEWQFIIVKTIAIGVALLAVVQRQKLRRCKAGCFGLVLQVVHYQQWCFQQLVKLGIAD